MNLDAGRQIDLSNLYMAYQKAESPLEKRCIEDAVKKIKTETPEEGKIREILIKAVRGSDTYSIKKYSEILNRNKHTRLNGRQF